MLIVVGTFLAVIIFITFQIRGFEKRAEKTDDEKAKAGYKNNAKVTTIVGLVTSAFMAVTYICINIGGVKMMSESSDVLSIDITRIVCVGMGIMFIVLGNYMPKTRRNSLVGIRCAWTQYNDVTWAKSNRFASYLVVGAGVIAIILAFVMKNVMNALLIVTVLMLIICVVSLVYSHKIYVQEVNSGKDRD